MSGKYDDILHLPRWISAKRPRMSNSDRAAQFSPFAALTGFDDTIAETGRLTENKRELTEGEKERLNERLQQLRGGMEVQIRYFEPDLYKEGGAYVTARGTVKKLDPYARALILTDGACIAIEDILCIDGECFADLHGNFPEF